VAKADETRLRRDISRAVLRHGQAAPPWYPRACEAL